MRSLPRLGRSAARAAVLSGALLLPALPAVAAEGGSTGDPVGTWLTPSATTRVRIQPCGEALCGTIVWSKADARDANNPDATRRDRPLVGTRLFSDARPTAAGWEGSLYNPQDGRTYAGKLRMRSAGELDLAGCVLGGLFCKSQTWTRVQ